MAEDQLRAGCASADITPPAGIHMGGYWGRRSGAIGIRDPLMAKVLVIAQGEERVALAALDLVGLEAAAVQQFRAGMEGRVGIPAAGVMVCCSHTHAGPLTLPFRGMGDLDSAYLARVQEAVVGAAVRATDRLQPARLSYCRVPAHLGINRRQKREGRMVIGSNPEGPVADYAHVLRVGQVATLFSHACHPVILGKGNHQLSAEFPGAATRLLEARTGRPALFVNGACGDINPRLAHGGFDQVDQAGAELAEAVLQGLDSARELEGGRLACRSARVPLPLMDPPPRLLAEVEKLGLQLKAEIHRIAEDGGDLWAQRVPRARLEWAEAMRGLARQGVSGQVQPFEIQALQLGGAVLLGMEGEIFVRYQLDLEPAAPLQPALLCGYANGCIGYVPTAEEYPRGGYEVDEAYKVYPSVQMIGPESEGMIKAAAARLLEELASGR
ncbi:MAG: hypothetical protein HYW07_01320 [Candidatus Latescibacteria bacterium]|nr:hypothetical protein [Candidatus Latescibacterota bacterium]